MLVLQVLSVALVVNATTATVATTVVITRCTVNYLYSSCVSAMFYSTHHMLTWHTVSKTLYLTSCSMQYNAALQSGG
jgi:hypothetical protein